MKNEFREVAMTSLFFFRKSGAKKYALTKLIWINFR